MTTALFLLRCKQNNLSFDEIDALSIGAIYDIFTESLNDSEDYAELPSQADFDNF